MRSLNLVWSGISHLCGVLSNTDTVENIIVLSEHGVVFVHATQDSARSTRDSSSDQNKSSQCFSMALPSKITHGTPRGLTSCIHIQSAWRCGYSSGEGLHGISCPWPRVAKKIVL